MKTKTKGAGLHAVVTLFLITAVMALLLALVNGVTAEPIRRATEEKTQRAFAAVLGPGVVLGQKLEEFPDDTGLVQAVYETSDGYVVEVAPAGYGGEIDLAVGVSGTGAVTGVAIIRHTETASLGANAASDGAVGQRFRDQFLGARASDGLSVTKDGGTVEALTGATVTSRAVAKGVDAALRCAAALEGGDAT